MFSKQQSLQIKGGAIILLLFHHLFYTASRFEPYGVTPWFLSEERLIIVATAARVCVWIFVFVSAYGIATLFEQKVPEKSICRFVFERWISLMKGYWFIYPLAFILLTVTGNEVFAQYKNSLICMFIDWSGWSDFFKTPTLMGGWWYMCFAQILVIVMPVCIGWCKKWNYLMLPFILLATQYIDKSGIISPYGGGIFILSACNYSRYIMCAKQFGSGTITEEQKDCRNLCRRDFCCSVSYSLLCVAGDFSV